MAAFDPLRTFDEKAVRSSTLDRTALPSLVTRYVKSATCRTRGGRCPADLQLVIFIRRLGSSCLDEGQAISVVVWMLLSDCRDSSAPSARQSLRAAGLTDIRCSPAAQSSSYDGRRVGGSLACERRGLAGLIGPLKHVFRRPS